MALEVPSALKNNSMNKKFSYKANDLIICSEDGESQFDKIVNKSWLDAMKAGYFRYELGVLQTKIVSSKYRFVVQLNVKRATERRTPLPFFKVQEPFNDANFNFKKINKNEVLFELQPEHWKNMDYPAQCTSNESANHDPLHEVIINVSPLENCHSLLVPFLNDYCPQVLTLNSLKLAIEVVLLSKSYFFRVGYNSLGGFASVNHLHFHLYYLKQTLYIETVDVSHLAGNCFELLEYPANGFVFQIIDSDVLNVVRDVMKLVSFLVENNIAHNVFITRGYAFSDRSKRVVRIFVWARHFFSGAKDEFSFNPAVCELAGHIPVKSEMFFSQVTEDDIVSVIQSASQEIFWKIRDNVKQLYF